MTRSGPVRVLLVEDNEVYRSSLELLLGLQPDVDLVGSVATGAEAITEAARLQPQVALVDFRLPDMGGEEVTATLRATAPWLAVLCLTAAISPEERESVLAAGAVDIVEKGEAVEQLLAVIQRARKADA